MKETDHAISEDYRGRRCDRHGRPHAADVLAERGHQVVPMSRSQGVDVITGDGLAAALAGVGCVIDAATGSSPR